MGRWDDLPGSELVRFLMDAGAGEATDLLLVDESLCIRCDNCEKACSETHGGVSRLDREAGPRNAGPRLTNARHLTGTRATLSFDTERAPDRFETSINGNDVSLEQQLTRLGQTQLSYQATTNLYRKHLDMFRIALGRGR